MREEGETDSSATIDDLPSFGKPPKIYGCQHTDCSEHLAAADKAYNDAVNEGGVEFAFMVHEPEPHLPITADKIFSGGQICPLYSFNRSLRLTDSSAAVREKPKRLWLEQFLKQERKFVTSPSSADELVGISPGTYCLWSPGSAGGNPSSAGGPPDPVEKTCSREWLFRRLIRDMLLGSRCSRGKETVVFLTAEKKISPRNKVRANLDKKEKTEKEREGMDLIARRPPYSGLNIHAPGRNGRAPCRNSQTADPEIRPPILKLGGDYWDRARGGSKRGGQKLKLKERGKPVMDRTRSFEIVRAP